jgi:PRC-barrel domain
MVTGEKETDTLIGSDKVEGTAVYGSDQSKIGSIERLMINKTSGKIDYAVLSFGGFLGLGSDQYPLPWHALKYDSNLGGYLANVTEEQLRGAPRYTRGSSYNWTDPSQTRSVDDYYSKSVW